MMMQWVRVIAILTAAVIAQDDPWNLKQVYWEEHRGKITKHTSPKAYDAHAVSKERVASISGKGINTGGHVRFGLSENNSNAVAEYHIALMPHGAFDDKNRHASWGTGDRFEVFVNSYGDVEAWQYRSDGTSKKFKTWSRNGKTGKLFAKVSPYEHKNGMSDLLLMETKDENDYKWDKKQVYWEKKPRQDHKAHVAQGVRRARGVAGIRGVDLGQGDHHQRARAVRALGERQQCRRGVPHRADAPRRV